MPDYDPLTRPPNRTRVVVGKGETLGEIAGGAGITVSDLEKTPGNEYLFDEAHRNGNLIRPGEIVTLPLGVFVLDASHFFPIRKKKQSGTEPKPKPAGPGLAEAARFTNHYSVRERVSVAFTYIIKENVRGGHFYEEDRWDVSGSGEIVDFDPATGRYKIEYTKLSVSRPGDSAYCSEREYAREGGPLFARVKVFWVSEGYITTRSKNAPTTVVKTDTDDWWNPLD